MINIQNEKMSKSLGNVWWAKDLIRDHGGNVIRWMMISVHYRAPLNLSAEAIVTAKKELQKIQTAYKQAVVQLQLENAPEMEADPQTMQSFVDALNDDLNTPNAISVVYEVVKTINQTLRSRPMPKEKLASCTQALKTMLSVLGIQLDEVHRSEEDKKMYRDWRKAVKEKDFTTADAYRATLQEKGIL